MLYFLSLVCPPLAVLLVRRPGTAVLTFLLTLFFYVPGVIHALLVVNDFKADERARKYCACP